MNELRRHKKSDKIKWVFTGVAFLLVFVMLVGMCLQLFGTGKIKPSEWFKKDETEQTTSTTYNEVSTVMPYTMRSLSETSSRVSMEMELRETFSADNSITRENVNGKGAKWLSENTYDTFCYTAFFYVPKLYDENSYCFRSTSFYEYDTIRVGNVQNSNRFAGFLYLDFSSGESVEINCGDWSSSIGVFKLEITEKQMRICPLVYDYNEWTPRTETFVTGSNEYEVVKKTFLQGNLTLTELPESDFLFTPYVKESIKIYKNYPVKEPVPLPEPLVKEGHTFVGWFYDSAYTRPYDGAPIYEDTPLYAKYVINRYTVTFNSDGGTEIASQTVDWNTVIVPEAPTNTGYKFVGWFLSDGTEYTNQPIKSDITLTAHWEVIMCTVTFYVDGEVYTTKTVEYGTQLVDIVASANEFNLIVLSIRSTSGSFDGSNITNTVVTDDSVELVSEELAGADKVMNAIKQNKWQVIGGVVGGIAIIAVIFGMVGGSKRKRR